MDKDNEVKASHKDMTGPCRESAQGMLSRMAALHEAKAAGLRALLELIGPDVGTPKEFAMWELLCSSRSHREDY